MIFAKIRWGFHCRMFDIWSWIGHLSVAKERKHIDILKRIKEEYF